jgi:hypothetical protein
MLGAVGILKSFTDELRKVQAEREAQLLLEVLRRRLGELTFGDLAALITSPLGKKLAVVKVSEAFAAATASAGVPVVTTPSPVAPRAAKTSSKKASKSNGAKPDRKGKAVKPSKAREPKVAKVAKAAKAERSAKRSTKKTAAKRTTKALASAKPATTPSSAAEGRKGAEVSARTKEGRIAYDNSIVAAMREAGDWISGTALRAQVGGSRDQLRFGLSRLAAKGMITRIGERDATRYKLTG